MQGYHAITVAIVSRDAFSRAPVPNFDRVVKTAADELGVIELKAANAACMSSKRSKLLSSVDVPDLDCCVVGSAGEDVVIEL